MAISLMAIAKAYPLILRRPDGQRHSLREKAAQRLERGQRRLRRRHQSHPTAGRGVQHPERDLLNRAARKLRKAAPREDAGPSIYSLVDPDGLTGPGMPAVGDEAVVVSARGAPGLMGLVA
jgi:hypothetical protein